MESNEQTELRGKIGTDSENKLTALVGWSKKGKTHGHGQQCGDCREGEMAGGGRGYGGINGNGKKFFK